MTAIGSPLAKGNAFFALGQYEDAIRAYLAGFSHAPAPIRPSILRNVLRARDHYRAGVGQQHTTRIQILGADSAANVGFGDGLGAHEWVAAHPLDVIHLMDAHPTSTRLAVLYTLIWGTHVIQQGAESTIFEHARALGATWGPNAGQCAFGVNSALLRQCLCGNFGPFAQSMAAESPEVLGGVSLVIAAQTPEKLGRFLRDFFFWNQHVPIDVSVLAPVGSSEDAFRTVIASNSQEKADDIFIEVVSQSKNEALANALITSVHDACFPFVLCLTDRFVYDSDLISPALKRLSGDHVKAVGLRRISCVASESSRMAGELAGWAPDFMLVRKAALLSPGPSPKSAISADSLWDNLPLVDGGDSPSACSIAVMRPSESYARPIGINLVGYASAPLGLGEELRQIAGCLLEQGLPFSIIDVPTSDGGEAPEQLLPYFSEDVVYPLSLFCMSPMAFAELMRECPARFDACYRIGNFFWELERYPRSWEHALDAVDEIWSATPFVAEIFRKLNRVPVCEITTPAKPPKPLDGSLRSRLGIDDEALVFGFMFDCQSTFTRKNPEGLIFAYLRARERLPENVRTVLLIKIHRCMKHNKADLTRIKRHLEGRSDIILFDESLPRDCLGLFYNTINIYVSLHRSEGLGRTIIEAAQWGLPVICTDYSGSKVMVDLGVAKGVGYALVPCQPGDYPGSDGSVWAEPDIEHAAELMVEAVTGGEPRRDRARFDAHFSGTAFVNAVRDRLTELVR